MRKTKLTARVKIYDMFGYTSIVEFPIYTENDNLYAKVMGDYISVFHPDLVKNGIRIMQPLKNR